ncbi:hypothetical protein AB0F15_43760 [Amycolatopsis sp. NPDC026612]|uniref:hypothetical protein n=1 Tax=Amycolatopsis sp. NPDC026612 TaxID=3155466 RepID=UPI0033F75D87
MTAVLIPLERRDASGTTVPVPLTAPRGPAEIEFVEHLDDLVESSKCSCNAGDDNPY